MSHSAAAPAGPALGQQVVLPQQYMHSKPRKGGLLNHAPLLTTLYPEVNTHRFYARNIHEQMLAMTIPR